MVEGMVPTRTGQGPLAGVRVVDFGHQVAGVLLAVLLADQGADVVHVDPPGAPDAREPSDAFYNRNKRRITLDLKQPGDLAVARRLVRRSDVLVENFRPGVMDRLGLGDADVRAMNPGLVYCSLPGFPAGDPRAHLPAWEGVVDAATGNCRVRAGEAPDGWDATRPTYSAVPVASNFAAFLGAVAVVGALTERRRSGLGQHVEVPLYDAMFEAIGNAGSYPTARGVSPQRPLSARANGTYRCADGRHIQFNPIGATPRFVSWFLQAAGKPDWTAETDETVLRARITELFTTRTAAEWEQIGNAAGVPLALVRTAAEWLETAHARESGEVVQVDDPLLGPTWMPGAAIHHAAGATRFSPRHRPDSDRAGILEELDGEEPEAPAGPPAGAVGRERPMSGLRVLDLTQILAGPSSARILGELGAEVVKINVPHRPVSAHALVNRGKQTILVDVQNPAGQDVFWELAGQADVIVQNFPPGTAERYGIGYESVRARRPGVVYVSVSCYGSAGPWAPGRGYETQGQAVTGIMARAGGDGGRPAVLGPYNLLDYGTGVLAAFAAALGVYERAVTGRGSHRTASLAQTGTFHQARYLLDYDGKAWTEASGPAAVGGGPLQRFYRAADGWFFLGLRERDLDRLRRVAGLQDVPSGGERLGRALEDRFATGAAADWVHRLQAAGLGAHEVVSLAELMEDETGRRRGLSVTQTSEEVGEVTMPGIAIAMSDTPPRLGAPVRRPGADAAAVLDRVGLAGDLARLERRWAVQTTDLPTGWREP